MKRKNHKSTRILSVFAILAMLLVLFACAGDETANNSGNIDETFISSDEWIAPEAEELQSPIPADLKFGGEEIRILNCTYFQEEIIFVNAEEEIGEVVNDSVYRRNLKVQGDLDVNFRFIDVSLQGGANFSQMVRNSVNAGSDDYDIIFGVQYDAVQLATVGVYKNLVGMPYIDLDQPWWPAKHIQEELSIGNDVLYFLTGDISLNFVRNMGCAYFNKQLYEEYFGEPDDMFKLVLDGKWTHDRLSEMARAVYRDLNGSGQIEDDDQFGAAVITSNLTDHFTYAAGVRVTARDDQGIPYLIMNNERTINYVNTLYNLYYHNDGIRIFPPTEETNLVTVPVKFMRNELLFAFGWFYTSELLRDMPTDYGIIPFPKLDVNQPTYLSLAHDIVPLYSVPVTVNKIEAAGAVLEAMAFESYREVLPAYYETALKIKYTRDATEDALIIIDMIHANVTTDFGYVYNYALNNVGLIMRELMGSRSPDFISRFERMEARVETSLERIVAAYLDN